MSKLASEGLDADRATLYFDLVLNSLDGIAARVAIAQTLDETLATQ
ncbi:MAG: hypothetical protein ACREU2_12085 [Steroidobacteraceae bacterium]